MEKATSKDGTPIAFERMGTGPTLVLVDGALCSRAFGPSKTIAPYLSRDFTVIAYDRRGRNDSGDAAPYSKQRELEDLSAVIEAVGGEAFVVGLSSGAGLALEAAASGVKMKRLAAYEAPYVADKDKPEPDHPAALERLLADGRRGAAVAYFMRDMVHVPAIFVAMMRLMFPLWRKLAAVAHTLPYDAKVMGDFSVPASRFASIQVPVLVLNGEKTDDRIKRAARELAAAIPGARHEVLPGQTHNVKPEALAPALKRFFGA